MGKHKKRVAVKYYEVRVYDDKEKLVDRARLKAYPTSWAIRQIIEMNGGTRCTITDYYRVETVNEDHVVKLSEVLADEDKWLYYKIWNPNMKDNIPYEGCLEYPYNRLGVISVIKIAAYNGLLVTFNSPNEKAAHWANWYAWEYDCSPLDFSDEEREQDEDDDLFF